MIRGSRTDGGWSPQALTIGACLKVRLGSRILGLGFRVV